MVSSALAAALARRNIHYGWIVVAVTFLTMLVTAGAMGAPGVMDFWLLLSGLAGGTDDICATAAGAKHGNGASALATAHARVKRRKMGLPVMARPIAQTGVPNWALSLRAIHIPLSYVERLWR